MPHRPSLVALFAAVLMFLPQAAEADNAGSGLPALHSIDQVLAPQVGSASGLFPDFVIGKPTVTRTGFALQAPYMRLKDLRPDSEMPTTSGLQLSAPLFKGQVMAESEIANNHADTDTLILRNRAAKSMLRFALSTHHGPFRYGLTYRLADQQFFNLPDQELREVWGEWSLGSLRLRSSVSELFTNVEANPTVPRSAQTGGRMMVALAHPSWPELSVTYARQLIDTNALQSGLLPQQVIADSVEGALALTRGNWNARFSSSYSLHANRRQSGEETVSYAHLFSGVFRPIEPLSITSIISYRTDVQQWTGVKTDSPLALLTVQYRHSASLMISALGGYSGIHSSDGMTANESLNSKGILTWSPWGSSYTQVSLETGYTRTVIGGASGGGMVTEDLSGLVRFRLTQF